MKIHQKIAFCFSEPKTNILIVAVQYFLNSPFRQTSYSLTFDSMELDDPTKYDGVRRLTNSDSPVSNPYFPNKWKIYWWNNFSWEEYDEVISPHNPLLFLSPIAFLADLGCTSSSLCIDMFLSP